MATNAALRSSFQAVSGVVRAWCTGWIRKFPDNSGCGTDIVPSSASHPVLSRPPRSLLQLVVSHQVQRPAANRNYAGRRQRFTERPGFASAAPLQSPTAAPWQLAAVRADQATETADTGYIQLISDITRGVDEAHAAAVKSNTAAALEGFAASTANELKQKVQGSCLDLQTGLLERETEVGAAPHLWN